MRHWRSSQSGPKTPPLLMSGGTEVTCRSDRRCRTLHELLLRHGWGGVPRATCPGRRSCRVSG
jgi:hypothetical protein